MMHISNPGTRMAPAVFGEFEAFYSASILAVTANPIYELASLMGQIRYDGPVPVSGDVPIYCNVPVRQTNHLLADWQHSPSGRLWADVRQAYCNMQKVADVKKSGASVQITEFIARF